MGQVGELSLIDGWLPAALTIAGIVALLALLVIPPYPPRWPRTALIVIIVCGLLVAGVSAYAGQTARLLPAALPAKIVLWGWLGVTGLALAIVRAPWLRRWAWLIAPVAVIFVIVAAATQINRFYGQYPTLGTVFGVTRTKIVNLPAVPGPVRGIPAVPPED